MSDWARPWKREPSRPPIVGITVSVLPSILTWTFGGSGLVMVPFGPFTSNAPSLSVTVTPLGSVTGRLPVRDCLRSWMASVMASPNAAKQLAADLLLAGFLVGHHA